MLLIVDVGKLTVSLDKDVVLAPTKEVMSLRAYTVMSQMNRLRRASCHLYQQMSMTQVIEKLECQIEIGHLAIRSDRMLHADLGMTQLHLPNPFVLLITFIYHCLSLIVHGTDNAFSALILLVRPKERHAMHVKTFHKIQYLPLGNLLAHGMTLKELVRLIKPKVICEL